MRDYLADEIRDLLQDVHTTDDNWVNHKLGKLVEAIERVASEVDAIKNRD